MALILLLLINLSDPLSASAQTADHQRLAVQQDIPWTLQLGLATQVSVNQSTMLALAMDSAFNLAGTCGSSWSWNLAIPFNTLLVQDNSAICHVRTGLGDLSVHGGWSSAIGNWHVRVGMDLAMPTAQSASAEAWLPSPQPGSGGWSIGSNAGVSLVIDPVVLVWTIHGSLGLPHHAQDRTRLPPTLTLGTSVAATEVLNDSLGYTVNVSLMHFSTLAGAITRPRPAVVDATVVMEWWWVKAGWTLRVTAGRSLWLAERAGFIGLATTYQINGG
jgi:hypothetical protein